MARNFLLPLDYESTEREVRLIGGDHDLLGDGAVELLLTPGHTPGHPSVRVGTVVIGGDVAHFAGALDVTGRRSRVVAQSSSPVPRPDHLEMT